MPEPLCSCLLDKIHEQIERAEHLLDILPPEQLSWAPAISGAWSISRLLGHLIECLAGFCAVLAAADPQRLAHFAKLREIPINHPCTVAEARDHIAIFRTRIDEGFEVLQDKELTRRLPTVFVQSGEPVLTLLLGNLEHLINHKHQLFLYLKLSGGNLSTKDLYCFRKDT